MKERERSASVAWFAYESGITRSKDKRGEVKSVQDEIAARNEEIKRTEDMCSALQTGIDQKQMRADVELESLHKTISAYETSFREDSVQIIQLEAATKITKSKLQEKQAAVAGRLREEVTGSAGHGDRRAAGEAGEGEGAERCEAERGGGEEEGGQCASPARGREGSERCRLGREESWEKLCEQQLEEQEELFASYKKTLMEDIQTQEALLRDGGAQWERERQEKRNRIGRRVDDELRIRS